MAAPASRMERRPLISSGNRSGRRSSTWTPKRRCAGRSVNLESEVDDLAPDRLEALPLLGELLGLSFPENDFTQA